MKLTPLQKRAERKKRNQSMVDLNLVSLIDVFTLLIFFLLANSGTADELPAAKGVRLPLSTAEKNSAPTVVVAVSNNEILVDGRKVADAAGLANLEGDLIAPLKAALDGTVTPAGQPKAVTIMGDKDIPYRLLRKVMYTCALADYADVSFAVERKT